MLLILVLYCAAILMASLVGGWIPLWIRLTHKRMELAVSFVAGVMLGVGMFHMVPHAFHELRSVDRLVGWVMAGLLTMFFLIRVFHFHQHHATETIEGESHDHPSPGPDHGDHACPQHDAAPQCQAAHRLSWIGVVIGLATILIAAGIMFCISGLSMRLSRKILDYSVKQVSGKKSNILLYLFRCCELIYNFQAGIWRGAIDEDSVNEALKIGDFPFATGQLLYLGYIKIELGDFAECETIIKKLHRIYEEYNFEHAESDVCVLKTKLSMKATLPTSLMI